MHVSALRHAKLFFETYVDAPSAIVDIGAQDVNGSLRSVAPEGCSYTGVDFAKGRGVDVVIGDPYSLPFEDGAFDVCVSSSCFEHSEFFWLTFLEIIRILKSGGLFYLNVPSNGFFHRFPVDCWRFYPDSGIALEHWARRNGYNVTLLESFTGAQHQGIWNDFVAVFGKDRPTHPTNIQENYEDFTNGYIAGRDGFANFRTVMEDQRWKERWWRIKSLFGRPPE